MQSTFEKLGGTDRQEGDYLLPNVEVPENPSIGVWGQRRHKYLMEHNYTKSMQNPTNPTRQKSARGSRNWKSSSALSLWRTTTPSSTSAAICVAHTSEKRLSMVCNTGHIYWMK